MKVSHRDWLAWAGQNNIHPWVMEYIQNRPDHLWAQPPKTEQPFSTPRSWHMLSDALYEMGEDISNEMLEILSFGYLSPHHAGQFKGFIKQIRNHYALSSILKGQIRWPDQPEDRDVCDAATYDQGYMAPEDIAESVKIRGRGGTVLQPAVTLLENAADFPKDGPILIITDGYCDPLRIRREHAFVIPRDRRLAFAPRGKVFIWIEGRIEFHDRVDW